MYVHVHLRMYVSTYVCTALHTLNGVHLYMYSTYNQYPLQSYVHTYIHTYVNMSFISNNGVMILADNCLGKPLSENKVYHFVISR